MIEIDNREYRLIDFETEFNFYQEEIAASIMGELAKYQNSLKSNDDPGELVAGLFKTGLVPKILALLYIPKEWEVFEPEPEDENEHYYKRVERFKKMPKSKREDLEGNLQDFFTFATKSMVDGFQMFFGKKKAGKQTQKNSKNTAT